MEESGFYPALGRAVSEHLRRRWCGAGNLRRYVGHAISIRYLGEQQAGLRTTDAPGDGDAAPGPVGEASTA
jgi:hypothetical protein